MTTPNGNGGAPQKILAKVRALLEQAESTEFEPERDAFNARAAELMAKYGIERARLADLDPTTDIFRTKRIPLSEPYAQESGFFLCHIVNAMRGTGFVKSVPRDRRKGYDHAAILYGYESDLERAEMVWTSLMVQRAHGLAAVQVPYYDTPRAYRRSWALGFHAMAVKRIQLHEQRAAEHAVNEPAGGTGMELVLASRQELAERTMREENPGIKVKKTTMSGQGYNDGVDAARKADIGATKIDRSATRGLPRGGA
jgi:hypothetical protein